MPSLDTLLSNTGPENLRSLGQRLEATEDETLKGLASDAFRAADALEHEGVDAVTVGKLGRLSLDLGEALLRCHRKTVP